MNLMRAQNHNPTLPTVSNQDEEIYESDLYYIKKPSQEKIVQSFTQKVKDKTKKQIQNKNIETENKRLEFFEQLQKHQIYQAKVDKSNSYYASYQKECSQKSVNSNQAQQKHSNLKFHERNRIYSERSNLTQQKIKEHSIIDEIVQNQDIISKQKCLLEKVQDLKRLKLLKQYKFNHYCLPGVGKSPYVFNDTHSKCTNPGYSRNMEGGKFFTR